MSSYSPTDQTQECDHQWPADLRPEHRDYLWVRGVTPEAARARGYRSVRSGGGRNVDESYAAAYPGLPRRSGLLMPLHPLLGGDQRYQLRPDEPRLNSDQKPIKFESQAGFGNVLATSPLTASALRQETETIIIAEGVTRVDALAAYGIPAVAIPGCYAWRDKNGVLPDFEALRLSGNAFILAFDGDAASNPSVNAALARFARYLRAKGAVVGLLQVPDDDDGRQRGLDDYLAEERFQDPGAVMRELQRHSVDSIDYDPLQGEDSAATRYRNRNRGMPDIYAGVDDLAYQEDQILEALDDANAASGADRIYNRSDQRVAIQETISGPVVRPFSVASFRSRLHRIANFWRYLGDARILCPAPAAAIAGLFDAGPINEPPLYGVVPHPVLTPDGSRLVDAPGYDEGTGLFLDLCDLTPMAAADAVAELDRLFVDFPLETPHDRAGLYAMLVTPIIRPAVATAPMLLVTKPQPREGASLLTTLIGLILTGGSYQSIAVSNNVKDLDENLRKALASAIVDPSGRVMWRYDNMPATFDSPTLAELLTDPAWSTRLLGGNQIATLPQTGVTVYGTVNSVDISHELGLRCYETRINSGNPRPWERKEFTFPEIKRHVVSNRGWYLSACVALVRHNLDQGQPQAEHPAGLGGFEDWRSMMAGILAAAGIDGFMTQMHRLQERAMPETSNEQAFIQAWWDQHQGNEVTSKQLWEIAHVDDQCLLPVRGTTDRALQTSFGKLLRRLIERPFEVEAGVVSVARLGMRHKAATYALRLRKLTDLEAGEH